MHKSFSLQNVKGMTLKHHDEVISRGGGECVKSEENVSIEFGVPRRAELRDHSEYSVCTIMW